MLAWKQLIEKFDFELISRMRKLEIRLARTAIFVVYFWFGILKLLGVSPASQMIHELFDKTIWFMPFGTFYILFALFEMTIGLIFLVRGWERLGILLLSLHLFTTALPLLILPHTVWQGFLIPTLEGQYIIKNILIVSVAVIIGSRLVPLKNKTV